MSRLDLASAGRRRVFALARWMGVFTILCVVLMISARVMGQTTPGGVGATPAPATTAPAEHKSLMSLFMESFDLFTILLVAGSLAAWTIIIVCLIEVRPSRINPSEPARIIESLIRSEPARWSDLRQFVNEDDALICRIVRAAVNSPASDKNAMRESAELAASEENARWFRKLEPLNVIGNLGPLLGLAGTVWGMIIAFAALGESGGNANPAVLSVGISKALFHTLLGLLLAVPCLCVFGFYRQMVDKHCTRVMVMAAELIEMLPADARVRLGAPAGAGGNGAPRAPMPAPQPMPRPITAPR